MCAMSWMSTTSCLILTSWYSLTSPTSSAGSCWNVPYLWLTLRIWCQSSRHSLSTVFRSLVTARLWSARTRKWRSASAVRRLRFLFHLNLCLYMSVLKLKSFSYWLRNCFYTSFECDIQLLLQWPWYSNVIIPRVQLPQFCTFCFMNELWTLIIT